jgi:hypothetical protein
MGRIEIFNKVEVDAMIASKVKQFPKRSMGLLIALVTVLAVTVSVAYAALYPISTTDSSVSDWDPVQVFQTDPEGDAPFAGVDILETKVASMETTGDDVGDFVYFLVKTASAEGLGERGRVRALIDCNNNGIFDEFEDRIVMYIPGQIVYMGQQLDDPVFILHGNRTGEFDLYQLAQTVGQYYEWGVPISALFPLPDDTPELFPDDFCRGIVGVRFETIQGQGQTGEPPLVYDSTEPGPYALIDLPTAVGINSLSVSGASGNAIFLLASAGLVVIGTAAGLKRVRRRSQ